jgi:hypothetical protein
MKHSISCHKRKKSKGKRVLPQMDEIGKIERRK